MAKTGWQLVPLIFEFLDPEEILDSEDFRFVENFLKASRRTQIGWHYPVDLTWIYTRFKDRLPGLRVLDAGGESAAKPRLSPSKSAPTN